jgi:D-alanyl-D-alanine carboxypeptidase
MTYSEPTQTTARWLPKILVTGLLIAVTAIATALGYPLLMSSPSTTAPPTDATGNEQPRPQLAPLQALAAIALPTDVPSSEHSRPQLPPLQAVGEAVSPIDIHGNDHPGEADGVVPGGTTIFDDEIPGVAKLDPALLDALRQAATDAADDGVAFYVTSGWRSPAYQHQLLREAIAEYGSQEAASQWVASADRSSHVAGDAIDIGRFDAMAWLSEHGSAYGLCQIYSNEPWHYELRPEAIDNGCPPMYADPTHDPRMQQ